MIKYSKTTSAEVISPPTTLSRSRVFLICILAIPLFVSVDLFNISVTLDRFMNAWKIVSAVIIMFLVVNRLLGRKTLSSNIVPMFFLVLMLLFSTIINDGSFSKYLIVWGGFFAVCLLVESNIKEHTIDLLFALKISLGLIIVVNFVTVIAMPDGIWQSGDEGYWLLGHRNNFGAPIVTSLVIASTYDFVAKGRLTVSTFLLGIVSFVSVAITWSASSVVATALVIISVLLIALGRGIGFIKPIVLLVTYILVDVGIVFFRIQERWSDFIVNVLERSTDLTGRTRIWTIVIEKIGEYPIWGTGVQLPENNGLTQYNANFVHAHNGELDILYQGGFVAFIPFVIMILLATRRATLFYSSRSVQILFIGLILIMFRAITGLFFSSFACVILFLVLNSDLISRGEVAQIQYRSRKDGNAR